MAPGSTLLRTIRGGTSGATVHLLRQPDGRIVATKVARMPRVGAPAQAARRRIIAPRLGEHLPEVLLAEHHDDQDILVTTCPALHTLRDLVDRHGPAARLQAIWAAVVEAVTTQWQDTRRPGFEPARATRNHLLRCRRGFQGLAMSLAGQYGPPVRWRSITVNGVDCGPWAAASRHLLAMGRPGFRVTCHGDPHAANVVVDEQGHWYLVDWEWAGDHHDWRMLVSHLVGSWYVHDLLTSATGHVEPQHGGLELTYRPPTPTLMVAPLLGECVRLLTDDRHPLYRSLPAVTGDLARVGPR